MRQCGDDPTREDAMRQAVNLKTFHPAMLIDEVNLETGPSNYKPMRKPHMVRFDIERFTWFSEIINAGSG